MARLCNLHQFTQPTDLLLQILVVSSQLALQQLMAQTVHVVESFLNRVPLTFASILALCTYDCKSSSFFYRVCSLNFVFLYAEKLMADRRIVSDGSFMLELS